MSQIIDGTKVDVHPAYYVCIAVNAEGKGRWQIGPFLNHEIAEEAAATLNRTGRLHRCYVEEDKYPQDN